MPVEIDGGGWTRVRHSAKGKSWGPFTDQLTGAQLLGDPSDDSHSWSVQFQNKEYSEMLFATGDLQLWMIMDKS